MKSIIQTPDSERLPVRDEGTLFVMANGDTSPGGDPCCLADEQSWSGLLAGADNVWVRLSTLPPIDLMARLCRAIADPSQLWIELDCRSSQGGQVQTQLCLWLAEWGFRCVLQEHADSTPLLPLSAGRSAALVADGNTVLIRARRHGLSMRAFRQADLAMVLAAFKKAFHVSRSEAVWRWKYQDNPYGGPLIALCMHEGTELAAHFAACPMIMDARYRNHRFRSVQGGDVHSVRRFRKQGIGPTGVLAQTYAYFCNRFLVSGLPWGIGFNTGHARKLGELFLHYEYLPEVGYFDTPVDQLNLPATNGLAVRRIHKATAELDRFYASVADSYELLVQRDAEYLAWRYLDYPEDVYRLYGVWAGTKLVALGAFKAVPEGLFWGDHLVETSHALPATAALLREACGGYEGSRLLAWFSPRPLWWQQTLAKLGLQRKPEPDSISPMMVQFDRRYSLDEVEDHFYYTKGDSDLF